MSSSATPPSPTSSRASCRCPRARRVDLHRAGPGRHGTRRIGKLRPGHLGRLPGRPDARRGGHQRVRRAGRHRAAPRGPLHRQRHRHAGARVHPPARRDRAGTVRRCLRGRRRADAAGAAVRQRRAGGRATRRPHPDGAAHGAPPRRVDARRAAQRAGSDRVHRRGQPAFRRRPPRLTYRGPMGTKTLAAMAALAGGLAWAARDLPAGFGAMPRGARAERLRRSPHYRDGAFHNTHETPIVFNPISSPEDRHRLRELLTQGKIRKPTAAVPLIADVPGEDPDAGSLSITWYGHASALVEIDGRRVLLDPVWSDRCSPSRLVGPRRLHQVPVPLVELPAAGRDRDLPRPLRPPRHGDHPGAGPPASGAVPGAAGRRRPPRTVGRARRADHRAGLGRERPGRPGCTLTVTAARHFSGRASSTATTRCGGRG